MKKIGIIGAMDVEVEMLKSMLGNAQNTEIGGCKFSEGTIDGINVVIAQSGIGKVNAALCAQRLILQMGATHIINTGIAGAMGRGLKVQDVVVSTDALYHDFDLTEFGCKPCEIEGMPCSDFPADETMIIAAQKAFEASDTTNGHNLVKGRMASGDQFVASKVQKNDIVAKCNPMCVDMEAAAIAHAAYLCQVPYVVIRCMSDMADDGGADTYSFNKLETAHMSADIVHRMIKLI